MISVIEAKNIIKEKVQTLPARIFKIEQAVLLTLGQDIWAPANVPAFAQSAMDGYAFKFEDFASQKTLLTDGEMAAGDDKKIVLKPGQAVRIFTGAALPENADTVVMQEKINLKSKELIINDEMLKCGSNIRLKGSEIKAGEIAIKKGALLTAAAIGFLASI
ncbi:MAG: molybdopterin molybdenumtransferase MoeA, partial [Arachidicoccus sp.]